MVIRYPVEPSAWHVIWLAAIRTAGSVGAKLNKRLWDQMPQKKLRTGNSWFNF